MTGTESSVDSTGRTDWSGRATSLAKGIYRVSTDTELSLLAAALAYYAFVSMVPLVVLAVVAATTIGGDALADQIVGVAANVLTPTGEDLLRSAVTARTGRGGVTVVGVVVLVWGALKGFRALDRTFSMVYGTRGVGSLLETFVDALLALTAVGAAVASMVVIGAAVAVLPGQLPGSLSAIALFFVLVVVFLPLYFIFPDAELAVREVLPGAVLAALGWTGLASTFQFYAATVSGASVYGLLGGVLLALAWLYVGAFLLLLGAVLNAVRSGHAQTGDQ